MGVASELDRLTVLARDHPVAAALEVGTLLSCVTLLVGTLVATVAVPPAESTGIWLGIVALGATVVLLWTVVVPLAERITSEGDR